MYLGRCHQPFHAAPLQNYYLIPFLSLQLILRHAPVGEHYIEDDLEGQVYLPESDNLYVFKEDDGKYLLFTNFLVGSLLE